MSVAPEHAVVLSVATAARRDLEHAVEGIRRAGACGDWECLLALALLASSDRTGRESVQRTLVHARPYD